jgi:hypothetical protein
MSDLTVNPQVKVQTFAKDGSFLISTSQSTILKCLKCGGMRDVSLHQDPTEQEMQAGQNLKTGSNSYPMMQQCRCNAPDDGGDIPQLLADINIALAGCRDIRDVRDLIMTLAVREADRRSGKA